MQLITNNQQEFMRMLSEPPPPGTDVAAALRNVGANLEEGGEHRGVLLIFKQHSLCMLRCLYLNARNGAKRGGTNTCKAVSMEWMECRVIAF